MTTDSEASLADQRHSQLLDQHQQLLVEVRRVLDALSASGGSPLGAAEVEMAVARGFARSVMDPATWDAMLDALGQRTEKHAGRWMLGGLRAFLSRLSWFVAAGLVVYWVGGWSALAALAKHLLGGGQP